MLMPSSRLESVTMQRVISVPEETKLSDAHLQNQIHWHQTDRWSIRYVRGTQSRIRKEYRLQELPQFDDVLKAAPGNTTLPPTLRVSQAHVMQISNPCRRLKTESRSFGRCSRGSGLFG
jgi:hypothetical protein